MFGSDSNLPFRGPTPLSTGFWLTLFFCANVMVKESLVKNFLVEAVECFKYQPPNIGLEMVFLSI